MKTQSSMFTLTSLNLSTGTEFILQGGRNLFPLLPRALSGIRKIAVVGWGKQAPAQAMNFRDSLQAAGSDIVVQVALRETSNSFAPASAAGFSLESGTLGTIERLVPGADLVLFLVSDAAQTEHWKEITGLMKPGATLGFSHGFLLGHLKSTKQHLRNDINIVMVAPKGVGDSVRKLYLQGADTNGAGINASVAVEQDINGKAFDIALAWSVAIGSPVTFFTTMEKEVISDLVGERAMLLGGLWGLVEALYEGFDTSGKSPTGSFLCSAKGLTSTVTSMISQHGLLGLYKHLPDDECKAQFQSGYDKAYDPARTLIAKIYNEVASWREIERVVKATGALEHTPMSSIETTNMWVVGRHLYGTTVPMNPSLALSAGMYVGALVAGIELLIARGHCGSEAYNEQLIEAIDSLNILMDNRGVGYMVDRCSITARIGAREWGPRFAEEFSTALAKPDHTPIPNKEFARFLNSPMHADIAECFKLRPSVKLVV